MGVPGDLDRPVRLEFIEFEWASADRMAPHFAWGNVARIDRRPRQCDRAILIGASVVAICQPDNADTTHIRAHRFPNEIDVTTGTLDDPVAFRYEKLPVSHAARLRPTSCAVSPGPAILCHR